MLPRATNLHLVQPQDREAWIAAKIRKRELSEFLAREFRRNCEAYLARKGGEPVPAPVDVAGKLDAAAEAVAEALRVGVSSREIVRQARRRM